MRLSRSGKGILVEIYRPNEIVRQVFSPIAPAKKFTEVAVYLGDGNNHVDTTALTIPVHIVTGSGDDSIRAGNGANTIDAGGGNNYILTGAGNDTISAGDGFNTVLAGAGKNACDTRQWHEHHSDWQAR